MASINTIAKEYADELRDGIAWVIVWKTGRSWNAKGVWLNYDFNDEGIFEPEDAAAAYKILEQDPNAIIINGYYFGHLGMDMTIKELAQGIRRHYEDGGNLKGSDFFPPEYIERIERPEDLPDDIPWCGKEIDTDDFNPYVFDNSMSMEDYELMHRLISENQKEDYNENTNLDECIRKMNRPFRFDEGMAVKANGFEKETLKEKEQDNAKMEIAGVGG